MTHYDVFNGDADGLCSLLQLRLSHPRPSVLVTGAKRDIHLLDRVPASTGDSLTVLDISLAANSVSLARLLERGASVEYFDHHYAGEVPSHPRLAAHIDPSPGVCTGMLVDRHLAGRHRIWAVVAAFGDNLVDEACELASSLPLTTGALARSRTWATASPTTRTATASTMRSCDRTSCSACCSGTAIRCASWPPMPPTPPSTTHAGAISISRGARRRRERCPAPSCTCSPTRLDPPRAGLFGNEVANGQPALAHAVLTLSAAGDYAVSVRAPRSNPTGADALCRLFPTGGGRAAAAGIDHLPCERLDEFIASLARAYPARTA